MTANIRGSSWEAVQVVLNLAKQRMETLPKGEVKVGGGKRKEVKEVWGDHYQQQIDRVEQMLREEPERFMEV